MRYMDEDTTRLYRAVIVLRLSTGEEHVSYRGPYSTKGAARSAVKRAAREYPATSRAWVMASGYVETAEIGPWERAED